MQSIVCLFKCFSGAKFFQPELQYSQSLPFRAPSRLCKNFEMAQCDNPNCPFAHGGEELRWQRRGGCGRPVGWVVTNFWQNFARFRLYRRRSLQVNMRFAAFKIFKIYQILQLKFLKIGDFLQILQHLQNFAEFSRKLLSFQTDFLLKF